MAPLARAFSALACVRFHESRYRDQKRTRQAETNPTAGVRELRTEHPRRKRATKIRTLTAKARNVPESRGNARAGASKIIALLLPVSSFARSGRKLVETRRWEFQKRLRGAAVSFQLPRRREMRLWRKIRSERGVLFQACATRKIAARRLPVRDSSVNLYFIS